MSTETMNAAAPALEVRNLDVYYGARTPADVSLTLPSVLGVLYAMEWARNLGHAITGLVPARAA